VKLTSKVRRVRLLPVVVVAASGLLVLKTAGLVFNGGYILTQPAFAAGGGAPAEPAGPLTLTTGPTVSDTAPLATDISPVAGAAAAAGGHGAPSAGGHGGAAAAAPQASAEAPAAEVPAIPATDLSQFDTAAQPSGVAISTTGVAIGAECPSIEPTPLGEGGGGHSEPAPAEGEPAVPAAAPRIVGVDCTPQGDALPRVVDSTGTPVPLATPGAPTEDALLARLAERRSQLDSYAEELDMRAALVDAAEQRIEERLATMQSLEQQISSLVEQRTAAESELIAGVVSMYENMRPRDAAAIFDQLDIDVLLPIAKAIAPRKMAPIMAAMSPARAQELTVRLAAADPAPGTDVVATGLEALPQIVGQ
jgi:flagellar motility protein MotE (MotC chaperone)